MLANFLYPCPANCGSTAGCSACAPHLHGRVVYGPPFQLQILPGWPCPACAGTGCNKDGSMTVGPAGWSMKMASRCDTCEGGGRVTVAPLKI